MSCQWPYTGIVLSAEEHHPAIGIEVMSVCMEVAETVTDSTLWTVDGCCLDCNLSDDAVPVGLCILRIGMTAGIDLRRHPTAVVHDDGEMMSACLQLRQCISLWGGYIIAAADISAV